MKRSVRDSGQPDNTVRQAIQGNPVLSEAYSPEMGIGAKILTRREELGIRRSALAKRVGLSRQTLYDLEKEKQQSTTKLHLLCKELNLNPDWVEFSRGPRLVSISGTSPAAFPAVESAPPDQTTTEWTTEDMGGLARDVVQAALLLTTLTISQRSAIDAVIRTFVATNKAADKHSEQPKPPTLGQTKPPRK
jgi:DNA-binding XRE family transcriptional regulator